MNILLWVVQGLAALMYGASGVMKVFMFDKISQDVPSFGALPRDAWLALGILGVWRVTHLLHADAPAPGTQATLVGGPLVEIVKVATPWAHLNLAVEFYGRRIQGLQLVHADKRGRWPWDRDYQGVRGGQPVLGLREPPERRSRTG